MNKIKLALKFLLATILNYLSKDKLFYIVENADWSIKHDGMMVTNNLPFVNSKISIVHYGIRNSIVHYGSINTFLGTNKIKLPHKSNKIIVTWFHIIPNDERVKLLPEAIKYVDIWHASCQSTKNKMIDLGIPIEKITVIPLGVDLNYFKPSLNKGKIKDRLNIPKEKIIIGSFQKDGNGWGEGLEPKLIKGPDIFCDVVEKLSVKYDIFVLLTGPARGYVKKRLDSANIQYKHEFFDDPNEVSEYFKAIDLYMVTSREEGGPKSILESMACGVPLVSTKVGMAEDIIEDMKNGFLVDIEDVDSIYSKACEIIDDKKVQNNLSIRGLETIKDYDWKNISNKYYEKLYKELI
jgi:glycosyltransferase involved in cell wall biosynthesis